VNVWAAIRRMLVFRRPHADDPRWLRVITFLFVGPLLRRVSRLWAWILLTTVLAIGLGFLPLFGVLGFELAVATALFAAVLGVDVGARLARELQTMPAPGLTRAAWPGRTVARGTAAAAGLAAAVMLIPAVISAVRGLWLPTCDWGFGIASYAALPLATAALAGAAGHLIGVLAGPRRVVAPLCGVLVLLAIAAAALWRFYAAPAVFTYNAILGYFPGNLYDEHVSLGAALAWSRLEQALWVVALGGLAAALVDVPAYRARRGRARRPAPRRPGPVLTAIAAAAAALALRWNGGALGYAIDGEDIEDALGGRVETPHFVIHYARTTAIEAEIALIAADHELRLAQVSSQIGVWPARKIRSFYFADREQKARLMGARDVEMAKPWRGEIYLDHRSYPHSSLRHEIAHAVAAEFGDPLFGVAARTVLGVPVMISPGLVEGLAVALDWPAGFDRPNPHESVRALQELGAVPSLRGLFGLSFFTVSSAKGYTTAGSFLRFLLDRHGPARLREVYRTGGDFERVYGVSRGQLEAEWRAMIATIVLPPPAIESLKERFRSGSVFARPCPHAIAARRELAVRALTEGDRARAIALLRRVCKDAPEEPRYRLELGSYLFSSDDPDHRAEAEQIWTAITAADKAEVTSSVRGLAYERLARAVGARDLELARRLVAEAAALPIDPNERRTIDGMAFALAHRGPAAEALRGYFFPPSPRAAAASPGSPTPPTPMTPAAGSAAAGSASSPSTPPAGTPPVPTPPAPLTPPPPPATPAPETRAAAGSARAAPSAREYAAAAVAAEPELGFARYLLGIQRALAGEWAAAAASLGLALGRELPGPAFARNAARLLAIAAYRAGDRHALGLAIATLSTMSSGDRALASDWLARITFDDTGRLP
jgi:hypothetical protein